MVLISSGDLCDPRFAELISRQSLSAPSSSAGCCHGLWPDFTLAYIGSGWFQFAKANGGEPRISANWRLGTSLLAGISGPLREFYREHFQKSLDQQRPWEHCYECSSAERFRWYHMITYPLLDKAGLLIVHSLRFERAHCWEPATPALNQSAYFDHFGFVRQCSYCRRVRRADCPDVWDWVRDWVKEPPAQTSHGVCKACFDFYMRQETAGQPSLLPFLTSIPKSN